MARQVRRPSGGGGAGAGIQKLGGIAQLASAAFGNVGGLAGGAAALGGAQSIGGADAAQQRQEPTGASTAIDRRLGDPGPQQQPQEQQQPDAMETIRTLQEAERALPELPEEIRDEYGPAVIQAMVLTANEIKEQQQQQQQPQQPQQQPQQQQQSFDPLNRYTGGE
jgi:hypothetical protein